jgi:hypothetical protein
MAATLALSGLLGCQAQPAAEPLRAAPVSTSATTIPLGPVSGRILGNPFSVGTARYSIDRRPHYQKVQIELIAGKLAKPCEDTGHRHDASVWLRHAGDLAAPAGQGADGWEGHYEVFEREAWSGTGGAEVVLELAEPAPDLKLAGELRACFPDRTKSCVAGSFVAVHCPIRIDALVRGTDSMERPPPRP